MDTDFGGALSFRAPTATGIQDLSADADDIVVEMANFDKGDSEEKKADTKSNQRLRSKINAKSSVTNNTNGGHSRGFGRNGSGNVQQANKFNNINHYVIDDEEDEDEE